MNEQVVKYRRRKKGRKPCSGELGEIRLGVGKPCPSLNN